MDEIWQSASIVEAHSWAVRIEDAHDMSVHIVIAVVGHGHRFRKTFCFVVYASRTNGIYVAPILFVLRRDFWVAITLAGRSQEKFRLLRKRKPERVVRAEGAHLESLDGKLQVIHGARGRSKVQNVVHRPWNVDVFRNVAPR